MSNKDKASNHSAEGCRRHESGSCKNPHISTTKYGLIIPLVVLLIGVLLLGMLYVKAHFIRSEQKIFSLLLINKYFYHIYIFCSVDPISWLAVWEASVLWAYTRKRRPYPCGRWELKKKTHRTRKYFGLKWKPTENVPSLEDPRRVS